MTKTPVVFIVFNRPEMTRKVFERIRQARPSQLLVVADGPRPEFPDDVVNCRDVRAIIESVDWHCEVTGNYADNNMGCRRRVSSGLDWVFNNVDEAIILEDDSLPHPTFFRFCEEMLDRFRDDRRIMHIGGTNYQFGLRRTKSSYYYSRYNPVPGWASWRRAWNYYDVNMRMWPEISQGGWLYDILGNKRSTIYWQNMFRKTFAGEINTWDYQWTFACWLQNGLSVIPNTNLISNIGYSNEATHTKDTDSKYANMPVEEMHFPLVHPNFMIRNELADRYSQLNQFKCGFLSSIRHLICQ